MAVEEYMVPTSSHHGDIVEDYAEAISRHELKMREEFIVLHIRKKPWGMPKFVHRWLVKKLLVADRFSYFI